MSTKIATLSKVLVTDLTVIRSLHRVLAEVVTQVATLTENDVTPAILAEEQESGSLCLAVWD